MSASLNNCQFIGRLGRDPETRYTNGGQAVANFTMAVDESFKDREGNRQKKTEWLNIVAWAKLAEVCQQYLHKGDLVYIGGRFQNRSWEDKEGQKRSTPEFVISDMRMLNTRNDNNGGGNTQTRPAQTQQQRAEEPTTEISNEDIPF